MTVFVATHKLFERKTVRGSSAFFLQERKHNYPHPTSDVSYFVMRIFVHASEPPLRVSVLLDGVPAERQPEMTESSMDWWCYTYEKELRVPPRAPFSVNVVFSNETERSVMVELHGRAVRDVA